MTQIEENDISRKFRPARLIIPVLIGVIVSGFLLYDNLTQVMFEEVEPGTGSYVWEDANGNGVTDIADEEEFIEQEGGNYKRITNTEALGEIKLSWYSLFWFIAAFAMMFLRDIGYMIRIRVLTENALSWKQSFFVIMVWEFASALTPGVVGGAAVAMFILNREKIPLGRSTAIVLITAMLDNLFYLIMVPLMLIFVGSSDLFPLSGSQTFLGMDLNIVGVFWVGYGIVFLFFIALLIGIVYHPFALRSMIVRFFSLPFLKRWKEGARQTGREIIVTAKEVRVKPRSYWVKAFGATFLSWTGRYLVVNCLIMAFVTTGLQEHFMIYARQLGMWVIMLISPTPGGSGIAEYAFTGFLEEFIPFGLVGLMAVLWRLISYYPYLFIGSFILPRWLRGTNKA